MNIKEVRWKNVLSYGKNWNTYKFKNGIDIISAENGLGKSVLLDVLNFAFFGKPYRKIKLNNLINFRNEKELVVEVIFKTDEEYKVVRGIKPNIFEIYKKQNKEWKLIPQDASVKDYQSKLEDIIGFNELLFRQIIVLGAGLNKNFTQLSSKEKEEFFENITNTYIINLLLKLAKEKMKIQETHLKDLEYKKQLLEQTITSLKSEYQKIEEANKKAQEDTEKQKAEIREQIAKLEKASETLVSEYNSKLQALAKERDELYNIVADMQIKKEDLEDKLKKVNTHLKILQSEKKVKCPYCQNEFIPELETKEKMELAKQKLEKALNEFLNEYNDAYQNFIKKDNEYNALEAEKSTKLNKIQQSLVALRTKLHTLDQKVEVTEIDYSLLEEKEKELEEVKQEHEKVFKETEKLKRLVKLFSDGKIKEQVLMTILPLLNKYINEYLLRFNAGFQFFIESNLKERVIKQGTELEFNNLSNGQKQRVILALLFAFLKLMEHNGYKINILVLDEFLDTALDEEGLEIVLDILNEFKSKKDVIIITHNISLSSKIEFNRKFTIEQTLGFSNLKELEKSS